MAGSAPSKNLDTEIAIAIENRDVGALEQMLDRLVRVSKKDATTAFSPALELKPAARNWLIADEEEGVFGDVAVATANKITRAKRRVQYELKVLGGFDGLRIASDGDSWFLYPVVLHDIIDVLSGDADKAVLSVDGAGDEVANMLAAREYDGALRTTNGHVLLFSAGGNDLLGEGRLLDVLKPFSANAAPADLLKEAVLRQRIEAIVGNYREVVRDVGRSHPGVTVIGHGYDISFPQPGGKWLGQALEKRKIPRDVGRQIVGLIVGRFNEALAETARNFANYRYIDLRARVGLDQEANWYDELHPTNEGYARAADCFREVLDTIARERAPEAAPLAAVRRAVVGRDRQPSWPTIGARSMRPMREAARATIVIDPGHGGSVNLACSDANHAVGPVHGLLEKNLTLDVALRVKRIFEANGRHGCILTREGDENRSGHDRADVARGNDAAVFLSIHFNASAGHNAQGTETWVHARADNSGTSAELCRAVQAAVRRATGLADRNSLHPPHFIKKANFCVINPANHADQTAAALVEVSFLDRADEEQRLTRDSYREEIAVAIVSGIESYLGAESADGAEAAALAEIELQDGASYYAERSSALSLSPARSNERATVVPWQRHTRSGALDLFGRPSTSTGDAGGDFEACEFLRVPIGDAPDFARAATNERYASEIVAAMFGGAESQFDFDAFGRFIGGLGLRHFAPIEFLFLGAGNAAGAGRCAGTNALPPAELWDSIANTARMLDDIRERLGAPMRILSAYRNEDYNRCIGGERGSLHMRFNAIDWTCARGTPEDWLEAAQQARASRREFLGGVGFYPEKRFIHIDTRGREANW